MRTQKVTTQPIFMIMSNFFVDKVFKENLFAFATISNQHEKFFKNIFMLLVSALFQTFGPNAARRSQNKGEMLF
jgi:hypothetical protein